MFLKFFLFMMLLLINSAPRSLDQKVATFFAKSSQKVATKVYLVKCGFYVKLIHFGETFFSLTRKFFRNFQRIANFLQKFPLNSMKSPIFGLFFPQFLKVATF